MFGLFLSAQYRKDVEGGELWELLPVNGKAVWKSPKAIERSSVQCGQLKLEVLVMMDGWHSPGLAPAGLWLGLSFKIPILV